MKENLIKLKKAVENYDDMSPILICGEAYTYFRKAWKYKIVHVSTNQEVKDVVDYYSMLTLDKPLVLDDLSNLSTHGINLILKLVEEAKFPIILLASVDNINDILLSRVKTVVKFGKPIESKFLNANDGLGMLENANLQDSNQLTKLKFIASHSPILYSYDFKFPKVSGHMKRKLISIVGRDE